MSKMLPRVSELVMSLRKNLWDEENRLKGIDLKPDDETDHPVAVYTYNAAGERIVRYNFDRLDVSSNAKEVGQQYKDNVMLYPSGLLMGKPSLPYPNRKQADLYQALLYRQRADKR